MHVIQINFGIWRLTSKDIETQKYNRHDTVSTLFLISCCISMFRWFLIVAWKTSFSFESFSKVLNLKCKFSVRKKLKDGFWFEWNAFASWWDTFSFETFSVQRCEEKFTKKFFQIRKCHFKCHKTHIIFRSSISRDDNFNWDSKLIFLIKMIRTNSYLLSVNTSLTLRPESGTPDIPILSTFWILISNFILVFFGWE